MTQLAPVQRYGFVMEHVLGHATHAETLRRVVEEETGVSAQWVDVTYQGNGVLDRLRPVPAAVRGTLRGYQQVRSGLAGGAYDALYFHTQKPAVFQWDLISRTPTVLSLDVTPRQYDELGAFYDHTPDGESPIASLKHWINCRTFALAHRVIAWSSWVTSSLVTDYGVAEDKIRVIPPGVDLDLWGPPPVRSREHLPRVLFVGGHFTRKGGDLLLDWFRQTGRGRCELDLVTRSEVRPEGGVRVYRDIAANTPEARRLFEGADIFVLPSLGECFGIAYIEALAAGLPVVATRMGGAPDIVDHGTNGFLIDPNDARALGSALDTLLGDHARRRAMGEQARAKAERAFDARRNGKAVLNCLEEAVQEARATRKSTPDPRGRDATQLHLNGEKTGLRPSLGKLKPW